LTAATGFDLSMRDPVRADDGSLETQKGGLFHRKGWISPEIYRAKPRPRKTVRTRGSRISRTHRRATSHVKRRAAKRAIPRDVVERREHQITRSAKQLNKPVRVASLTITGPSGSAVTGPELSIMRTSPRTSLSGGFLRINWRANRRCLAARLRATINHVAPHRRASGLYSRLRQRPRCGAIPQTRLRRLQSLWRRPLSRRHRPKAHLLARSAVRFRRCWAGRHGLEAAARPT
jgi:hypothetical protein